MQNRYTGDIGDFGKLGMLRSLARSGLAIGVNWYLVPDESHNGDGRHINYLQNEKFRHCDAQLWGELGHLVHDGCRQVGKLESPSLLPASYYSTVLNFDGMDKPTRDAARRRWHMDALRSLAHCELVFVDPDNGLMIPSAYGTPKSNKFVLMDELADYYQRGASIIYYQHKARRPDDFYLEQHSQLLSKLPGSGGLGLKFLTTSQRFYFFAMQPHHIPEIELCVTHMLNSEWRNYFALLSFA